METLTSLSEPLSPRSNPDLYGHELAERELLNSWRTGRGHHAWLLTGPKGIGKATLACRFARWILAGEETRAADNLYLPPDNGVFKRVATGGHSDFRLLEKGMVNPNTQKVAEHNIPVSLVRQTTEFVRLTPAESQWRVVVVDAADDLNHNAANALLKVLEEPPERAVFLLVSHAPARLLPTIRSRCRTLSLSVLTDADVENLLRAWRADIPLADRRALVRLAEGSPGRAFDLAAQKGLPLFRALIALLGGPRPLSVSKVHALAETLGGRDGAAAYALFQDVFSWWLARLIQFKATEKLPLPIFPEEETALRACAKIGTTESWLDVREKVIQTLSQSGPPANLDRRSLVINAFLKLERTLTAQP